MPIPGQYPSVGAPITSFRPLRLNLRELFFLLFFFSGVLSDRWHQYHKAGTHPTKDIRSQDLPQTEVSNKPVPPKVTRFTSAGHARLINSVNEKKFE